MLAWGSLLKRLKQNSFVSIIQATKTKSRLSLLVWFWFMSHVSDPYVIIGIMHDSIRVQMVSISMPW